MWGVLLAALLGGLGGGLVGVGAVAAVKLVLMDDRDTQAIADHLRLNGHTVVHAVFCRLVRWRSVIRRILGIKVGPVGGVEKVVRDEVVSLDELEPDVKRQLARTGVVEELRLMRR